MNEQRPRLSRRRPIFSIIVPSYNRPGHVSQCVDCLSRLRFSSSDFEIIVVDDGSSPPIRREDLCSLRATVRLIRLPHVGLAAARNRGAEAARGRYLAFTDDDCRPDRNWLRELYRPLSQSPDKIVTGRTENGLSGNLFSETSQHLISFLYDYHRAEGGRSSFFTGNNVAFGADLFRRLGGFDERFNLGSSEDRDLCRRAIAAGIPVLYEPRARVIHFHHLTACSFLRQHFRYGRSGVHYRRFQRPPAQSPAPSFFLLLLTSAYKAHWPRLHGPNRILVALLLSQAATACGLTYEIARSGLERSGGLEPCAGLH